MTKRLLNVKEAADYIGVVPGTLYRWRANRRSDRPKEIVVGNRLRWTQADLDEWLEHQKAEV